MKKIQVLAIAVATSVVLTGCTYPNGQPNNTGTGALIGAGSGAALGAALAGGHDAAAGAVLGGIFGALTGTLIGNSIDQQQAAALQDQAPDTYVRVQQNQPLSVPDVEALARAHVSDDVIITQIQNSHAVYTLSAQDIIDLHTAGVSDKVVNFMISTVNAPPPPAPTVVVNSDDPPPPPTETVVVAPGPGYIWIGGDWQWNGVGWIWVGGRWAVPPWPGAVWVRGYWYRGPFGGWKHSHGHWH